MLSGIRILGKVNCYQGGHKLTNMFLRKLLKNPKKYSIKNFENKTIQKEKNINQNIQLAVNA